MGSSVVERLGQTNPSGQVTVAVPGAGHTGDVVMVPMAALNWTASPRFETGYRLPSGFGEVNLAYRFLMAEGTGSTTDRIAAPDATAALRSHLNINVGDLDYASRETSLGENWDMKWRIGLRYADLDFDSRADEPFAAAAATGASGIFERGISDNFWGIGPHAALELHRQRNSWGLGLVGRLDAALLFGQVEQRFSEVSTSYGPGGTFLGGETRLVNEEQAPMLGGFLGLDWRPPRYRNVAILLGYTAEYWWNVGRLSDPDVYNGRSAGEVGVNGALLRMEYNY
jgi:hypothetical protein